MTSNIFSEHNSMKLGINYKKENGFLIPLLGIYPEKTIIQKESCTTTLITALFTIARTWTQRKCPSTDAWIKKM